MRLGRPVKWTEDRLEHFVSASHERGQLHEVEVACDATGRILGLRDRFRHDAGAYTPYGIVIPLITSTQLPGPYRIRHYQVEFDVLYTNKVMTTPYRGAGRPHGAFVMERVIGLIARELGLEPAEVRRRNLIQPDEFPWDVGLTFQDGGPTRYDSGNYPAGLEMALDAIGARDVPGRAGGRARRGSLPGPRDRLLRGGDRDRAVRGRPRAGRAERPGLRGDRPHDPGAGPPDDLRPDRCGGARVLAGRRHGGDRGHGRFNWGAGTFASRALVTSGNAVAAGGPEGPRQGAPPRGRAARGVTRRHRAGRRRGASQGRARAPAHARRPGHGGQPDPLRLREGGGGGGAPARQASSGRRPPRGRGAGARGARLLRAAPGHLRERLPRGDRRGGRRDRRGHASGSTSSSTTAASS